LFASACFLASCGGNKHNPSDAGTDGGSSNATCGNGTAEGSELCDGTDLRSETCVSATMGNMSGGKLKCTSGCTFDLSGCTGKLDAGKADEDGGGGTGG
jgi:hypothetical protein